MKSPPPTSAKPERSLAEKYAKAQADFAKWSMLAAAPIRGSTDSVGSCLDPEGKRVWEESRARIREDRGLFRERAHGRERNQLPKELQAKLMQRWPSRGGISALLSHEYAEQSAWWGRGDDARVCGGGCTVNLGLHRRRLAAQALPVDIRWHRARAQQKPDKFLRPGAETHAAGIPAGRLDTSRV
jgi:hypothetical protein